LVCQACATRATHTVWEACNTCYHQSNKHTVIVVAVFKAPGKRSNIFQHLVGRTRLAASLDFAFEWFFMFDLDQTFSPIILPYEQMSDRLATSAKKACASGKKQPIRNGIWVTS